MCRVDNLYFTIREKQDRSEQHEESGSDPTKNPAYLINNVE